MAYEPPFLACKNPQVAAAIVMATDENLKQAHYLLAARYPENSPRSHFGLSATIMMMLTIASASALRCFSLAKNKASKLDRDIFPACVEEFFPWDHITIKDGQHRPQADRRKAVATELYEVFRCPLIHFGGMVAKGKSIVQLSHVLPGLATLEENEACIAKLCKRATLGDRLIKIEADRSTIYSRPLYWCVRKMIEAYAADADVERDIIQSLGIKSQIAVKSFMPQKGA